MAIALIPFLFPGPS